MSVSLRVLLLVGAVLTAVWILRKIRNNRVQQEDALFWIFFATLLALLGIFPNIAYYLADKLGIISPANLVFLLIIAALIEKILSLSIEVSLLKGKIEIMSAEVAIRSKNLEDTKNDMIQSEEKILK